VKYILDDKILKVAQSTQRALSLQSDIIIQPANPKFGADLAIPCFKLAAELKKSPVDIAAQLAAELKLPEIAKTEAVNGFVNIWLSDKVLVEALDQVNEKFGEHTGQKDEDILIEHSSTNPFKEVHIGHLYSSTISVAIGRLLAADGAKVHHVSYHGDIGMHIAMAVWAVAKMLEDGEGDWFTDGAEGRTMDDVTVEKRIDFLGAAYALGATSFKQDEQAALEIKEVNKRIYAHDNEGIDEIYETGKRWSFDYFDDIFAQLGVEFEKRYFESEVGVIGQKIVEANEGTVFTKSDGALVYEGEKIGLHTRARPAKFDHQLGDNAFGGNSNFRSRGNVA